MATSDPSNGRSETLAPAPFVVGAGGSGTTTLRLMLDAHPELAIPEETHFLPALAQAAQPGATPAELEQVIHGDPRWGDFGFTPAGLEAVIAAVEPRTATGVARAFFRTYAERRNKPRWGDKTPIYVEAMRRIQRILPEAHFIHLIRDGRDVRLSRMNRRHSHPPIEAAARRWRKRIEKSRRVSGDLEHYMEVRFEDLMADPEPVLRRICEFIALDFDPVMLRYHESAAERLREVALTGVAEHDPAVRPGTRMERKASSTKPPDPSAIGRWREALSAEDIAAYEAEAGELLSELGYELVSAR